MQLVIAALIGALLVFGVLGFGWKLQAGPLAVSGGGVFSPPDPATGSRGGIPWIPIALGIGAVLLLTGKR